MKIYVMNGFFGFLILSFSFSFSFRFYLFCELSSLFDYAWPWYRTHVIVQNLLFPSES